MIAKSRLYWTIDRKRVVPANNKEAAFLFVAPGQEIPDELAKRYGLTEKAEEKPEPTPSPVVEDRDTRILTPIRRGRPPKNDSGPTGSR